MSRSGKFIPGASRRNRQKADEPGDEGEAKSEPIRATGSAPEGKSSRFSRGGSRFGRGGKGGRKPGQLLLFAGVTFLLIIGIGYYFFILPAQQEADRRNRELMAQIQKMQEEQKKKDEEFKKIQEQIAAENNKKRGTLIVDTQPTGAQVKFAGEIRNSPARIEDIRPGEYVLIISKEGYAPHEMPLKFDGDEVKDQGTIKLTREKGSLSLRSKKTNVSFVLRAPSDYRGETKGYLPLELKDVPVGDYRLTLSHQGWEIPYTVEVRANELSDKEIRFGYGDVKIETDPPGAIVSEGMRTLGETPLSLKELRPGKRTFGLDKFGYKFDRITVEVVAHEEAKKKVTLEKGRNLRTSFGLELVWVPELNIYVSKHEINQTQYLNVMGTNPSAMRGGQRPVDSVTWQQAEEFCQKATAKERAKGTIPGGWSFRLPSEAQWSQLLGDSEIKNSYTSHSVSRDGPGNVGASEPNNLGVYDMIGNVNEWTRTPWQGSEVHRTIRGGNWLSAESNFPDRSRAFGGGEKFRDKFTGFRVVLEK